MIIKFKLNEGTVIQGEVILHDEFSVEEDLVAVELKLPSKTFFTKAESYFEALQCIRKDLEHDGIQILCNGAARNVYPSPMMLNMGEGRSAYKVTFGHQALMKDVVDIFDYDESLICCSVEEQNQYYSNWVTSLRRR